MKSIILLTGILTCLAFSACNGGSSDGGLLDNSGESKVYLVEANVVSDNCGERVAPVRQFFTLEGSTLDTSIIKLGIQEIDGVLQGGFSESNGDCAREYDIAWTGAEISLFSRSVCGSFTCETKWQGTATESSQLEKDSENSINQKVRGENCNGNVPLSLGYRPSSFECNGNASLLLRGDALRSNYSVVVRRDGQFNDRDPGNPTCGTNFCSPYKTQKRIELPEYQVNCLGDSGYSANYIPVKRISIKFSALVTNPNDISQFEQYCLNNPQQSFN